MISFKNNLQIISWLIYSIPLSLVCGIFVTEIIVFLIVSLFLVYIYVNKDFYYLKSKFFKIFIIVYIFLIINSLLSEDIFLSLKVSLPYIRYGFLSLAIWFAYQNNEKFLKEFKYFFIPLIIFLLIDGFFQFYFGKNILGYSTQSSRLSSLFFDEWILGSYLQKFYPLLIIILFHDQIEKKYIYLNFIILTLVYLIVFLSGERTAFYLLNFLLIILFLSFNISKKIKFFLYLIVPLVILILINSPMKERVFLLDNKINFKDKIISFYNYNYKYYHKTSLNIFLDHKLLGSGVKTVRVLCDDYYYLEVTKSCSTHPHNYYMQILAECGILGIFIIFIFFIYLIYKYINLLIKNKRLLNQKFHQAIILSGLLVYLWPIATSGNFFNNFLSIILFFNLGLFIRNSNSNKL
jgi:O-antigen ligase